MGLAQNYQDPELFWAKTLIESESLRKISAITPFQITLTTSVIADFDFLPFVAGRTYLIKTIQAGIVNTFTVSAPTIQANNAFINTIELQVTFNNLSRGGVILAFQAPFCILTSRLRYANTGAVGGATSYNINGYTIDFTE